MASANWFETGFSAINKEEERQASSTLPNVFWMRVGEQKPIVFIDDEIFTFFEHSVKLAGDKFYRNITCIKDSYPDEPHCCLELGLKDRYLVGYQTIVNCEEKKDRDPKYNFELQLIQCKLRTMKTLRMTKEAKGSLVNMVFKAGRADEKSPRCGSSFMYDKDVANMNSLYKKVTYRGKKIAELIDTANRNAKEGKMEEMNKLKKIFQLSINAEGLIDPVIPAFNYMELLKPQEPKEIKNLLKTRVKEEGFGGYGASKLEEDSIPF